MKIETIGKWLMSAGAIVWIYAQNMSVTVGDSGMVNFHLISERQNTLMFAGILFLAGIIFFAVFKLKQTKEDVDIAAAKSIEHRLRLVEERERLKARVAGAFTLKRVAVASVSLILLAGGIYSLSKYLETRELRKQWEISKATILKSEARRLNVEENWDAVIAAREAEAAAKEAAAAK